MSDEKRGWPVAPEYPSSGFLESCDPWEWLDTVDEARRTRERREASKGFAVTRNGGVLISGNDIRHANAIQRGETAPVRVVPTDALLADLAEVESETRISMHHGVSKKDVIRFRVRLASGEDLQDTSAGKCVVEVVGSVERYDMGVCTARHYAKKYRRRPDHSAYMKAYRAARKEAKGGAA